MFGPEEHLLGWSVYLLFFTLVMVVLWQLTKAIPWLYFKQCLRLTGATALLVPVAVEEGSRYLAPAWVVGFLELIFSGWDGFEPIGRLLLIVVLLALSTYCLLVVGILIYQRFLRRRQTSPEA